MQSDRKDQGWIWVIVTRDQTEETIFGQLDEERNESFIPAFRNREDALMVLGRITRQKDRYYQVQAMRYEDAARTAKENGFDLFFLGSEGEILEKVISDNS